MFLLCVGVYAIPLMTNAQSDTTKIVNPFELAIRNATTLGLNKSQLSSLKSDNKIFKDSLTYCATHVDSAIVFNMWKYQRSHITQILTNAQYQQLLELKHQNKAVAEAQKTWKSAVQKNNIFLGFNKDTALKQLTSYIRDKRIASDRYYHNSEIKDSIIKKLKDDAPIAVQVLLSQNPYYGTSMSTQFGVALKYKDTLGLTPSQAVKIIDASIQHNKQYNAAQKSGTRFKLEESQAKQMKLILSPSQYDNLLTIYNSPHAIKHANSDWQRLSSKNMVGGFNKDSTINQLTSYYLNIYNVSLKFADSSNLKEQKLQSLYATMPNAAAIAKKIKHFNLKNSQTGQFTW